MTTLFGYYDLGLRALGAARLGLQVAGDNISNVSTPGFARRRVELTTGYPERVPGGLLDNGVAISSIRPFEDRFLQATLERERGELGHSEERLRGLRQIESVFGTLEGNGILSAYGAFSDAFSQLAAQAESIPLRQSALAAADTLARQIRETHGRLEAQRRTEDGAIGDAVLEVNRLATSLAELNREIAAEEADGTVAAPLRDQRRVIVEKLVELTGGTASTAERGKVLFSLPGGPTLVNPDRALPLSLSRDPSGLFVVTGAGSVDVTARLREGKLGALLGVRDDSIPARLADLDSLASDLIGRANALTAAATDLDGNAGGPLFEPDPAPATGAARSIAVSSALLADPRLLALSGDGSPGDNTAALGLANLQDSAGAALGGRTPLEFFGAALASLGNDIVQADVRAGVSESLVDTLEARRESISGVSLDDEAVELIKNQRAFEAAARFIEVINEITEIAVNLR